MITRLSIILATALVVCTATVATAQQRQHQEPQLQHQREQAREPYSAGIEHLRAEAFEAAEQAFRQAIAIDPTFEMAHYMLGRTHLLQKRYASAIHALSAARDLYLAQGTKVFESKNEIQSRRREWLAEIELLLQDLRAVSPQTFQIQEQIRQLEERKRQVEDLQRGVEMRPGTLVPAYVSLSLGSAFFRAGRLADAEEAYAAAIAADPKVGEAHNNLAVVYMETGRYDEAERAVKAAEKAGRRVHPDLKAEIARRKQKTE